MKKMYKPEENEIFHIHTFRCKHAEQVCDEAYVTKALELGAKRIVFTDHAPFPGDIFRNRMSIGELPEYISTINEIKEKYINKIEILCGLEVEYLPSYDSFIGELSDMSGIDVMVLGQHFYEHEQGVYSFADDDKSMEYTGCFKAMIEGIKTNYFDVVAHPDRAFRRRKKIDTEEKEIIKEFVDVVIANKETYLEKNYTSMRRKNQYKDDFWEMIPNQIGILYGYDAHSIDEMEEIWNKVYRKEN